jgi:DNA modification methylase
LKRENGTYYNKLDRHYYYIDAGKHVAKTPMHLARYLIQTYSKPGDWILDPTIGAGSTAVEAINHKRFVVGIELDPEFMDLVVRNVGNNSDQNPESIYRLFLGDARKIDQMFSRYKWKNKFSLVINNPPYAADVCEHHTTWDVRDGRKPAETRVYNYNKKYDGENIAKIKRDEEYYQTIRDIYSSCIQYLKPGGHFCIGVKDMIRKQKPYLLHYYLGCILASTPCELNYKGMILLPHYPTTIFMRSYPKKYPKVKIPLYQTILVFQKPGNKT